MFDLLVIGAGTAGYIASLYACRKGLAVALVEEDKVGGVCLNRGCIPSKALIASAEVLEKAQRAKEFGVQITEYSASLPEIMERKNKVIQTMRRSLESLIKANKIAYFPVKAKVLKPGMVQAGQEILEARNILLATGSSPATLPNFSFDGKRVLSTDHILELETPPEHLVILGAGPAGCEMGFFYSLLGSKVTILEILSRALPQEDADISQLMEREMRKRGITFKAGTKAVGMDLSPEKVKIYLESGETIEGSHLFVSVGRKYNTQGFGLEDLNIKLGAKGQILVNEKMQTNVPGIYAAGDVIGGLLLAHVASLEGRVAVDAILGQNRAIDYEKIPWGVFTIPEVGRVGLTEEEARARFQKVKIGRFPFRSLGRAHAMGEISGEVKIVAEEESDLILGAHIFGPSASELVHEVALLMQSGVKYNEIEIVFAHPTLSEAVMEALDDLEGMSLHKLP